MRRMVSTLKPGRKRAFCRPCRSFAIGRLASQMLAPCPWGCPKSQSVRRNSAPPTSLSPSSGGGELKADSVLPPSPLAPWYIAEEPAVRPVGPIHNSPGPRHRGPSSRCLRRPAPAVAATDLRGSDRARPSASPAWGTSETWPQSEQPADDALRWDSAGLARRARYWPGGSQFSSWTGLQTGTLTSQIAPPGRPCSVPRSMRGALCPSANPSARIFPPGWTHRSGADMLTRRDRPPPAKVAPMTEKETEGLALLRHYAAAPDGRVILARMADSIQVANRFERKHWTPTVRKQHGWTVTLRIGTTYAIVLRRDEVEILLDPKILADEERETLDEAAQEKAAFKQVPGSERYTLDWPKAAELWESVEKAHHSVLQYKRQPSGTENPEASAVLDFLNAELGLRLPSPPEALDDPPSDTERKGAFGDLLQSLVDLQFSREAVANYVLALQTKRFAILTGISGTGKTQIAMAVARAFPARIRDRRARIPAETAMPEDAIRMTARPYHFKYRQIVLPVAFVARIDSFLVPEPESNGGEIAVSYPEGLTKVRFWRDPNPARNVTWLLFANAHEFRDWYAANLEPGDTFFISFKESENPEEHLIEFRPAETEVG